MPVAEKLREARKKAQERDFQRALQEARREEAGGRLAFVRQRARETAQQAVKPARVEARGAAQEARKLAGTSLRSAAIAGGQTAASGARQAASRAREIDYTAPGTRRPQGAADDDVDQMFERAQNAATAAAPTDATLDPLSGPEQLGDFVTGPVQAPNDDGQVQGPAVDMLVVGTPADAGGMTELVLGGAAGTDDDPMEAFVTGGGRNRHPDAGSMEAFVTGRTREGDD